MHEWGTSMQPPGLMKMRSMHRQEHHQGRQAHHVQSMVCAGLLFLYGRLVRPVPCLVGVRPQILVQLRKPRPQITLRAYNKFEN